MPHEHRRPLSSSADSSVLSIRAGKPADAPSMLALLREEGGAPDDAAPARALVEPFGFSVVVHRRVESQSTLVAFETAFLLRRASARRVVEEGISLGRILAEDGPSPFPTETEVGRGNAGRGHDLLFTHFVVSAGLEACDAERVRAQMPAAYVEMHAGNRVRRLLYQARDEATARRAASGGFVPARGEALTESAGPTSIAVGLLRFDPSREQALYNLLALRLLQYRPPFLRFSAGAREVLRLACQNFSDVDISRRLGISAASLNSRWTRILNAAERQAFPPFANGPRERGPLLAHIRANPEELWPYDR